MMKITEVSKDNFQWELIKKDKIPLVPSTEQGQAWEDLVDKSYNWFLTSKPCEDLRKRVSNMAAHNWLIIGLCPTAVLFVSRVYRKPSVVLMPIHESKYKHYGATISFEDLPAEISLDKLLENFLEKKNA